MKYLSRIAFRNVLVNFRHSLAAVLSITAAFFAVVVFEGYISYVSQLYLTSYEYRSMFGDVLVENKFLRSKEGRSDPWKFYITKDQQNKITAFLGKHPDWTTSTVKSLSFQGMVTNGKVSSIFIARAHDVPEGKIMRGDLWQWNAIYGKPLHLAETHQAVLLGQNLGRILGCVPLKKMNVMNSLGSYIAEDRPMKCSTPDLQMSVTTESGQLNAMDLQVAGLVDAGYQEIDTKYIMLPMDTAQTLVNSDKITIQTFMLSGKISRAEFTKAFDAEVGLTEPDLKMMPWQNHSSGELYIKTMELLSIFRNFVIFVIISISTLSVFNNLIKIVKERTREIGTLLSLGFLKEQVLGIFILESIFLSLIGLGLGLILSTLVAGILNHSQIYYRAGLLSEPVLFQVSLAPLTMLIAGAVLITIAILSSYMACAATVRKKIIDCLQHA